MLKNILSSVAFVAALTFVPASSVAGPVDDAEKAAPTQDCEKIKSLQDWCFVKIRYGKHLVAVAIKPAETKLQVGVKVLEGPFVGQQMSSVK